MTSLPDLHDATFIELSLVWGRTVEVTALFRDGTQKIINVVVGGVTELRCTHESPWGHSVSVNRVTLEDRGGNLLRLQIALQSGDVTVIEGSGVSWGIGGQDERNKVEQ